MKRPRAIPSPANGAGGGAGSVPSFQQQYPAVPRSAATVRAALARFAHECGVSQDTIDAIALAVSEAVTNVVVHAYADPATPGTLEVTAAITGEEIWVMVTDAGSGLQPHRDSPGLGLGLAIIARVADGVDLVEPADGGLEVRMRFGLA